MLAFRRTWLLRESSVALFLLRDVTGKISLVIGGLFSVLERVNCLFLVGITSTLCWMLLDGLSSRW